MIKNEDSEGNQRRADPTEVPSAEADASARDDHEHDAEQDQEKSHHARVVPGSAHVQAVGRRIFTGGVGWIGPQ